MEDPKSEDETIRVWYNEGRTVNIGNYNSVKIDYGISQSLPAESLEAGEIAEKLKEFVANRIAARLDELNLNDPAE